MLATGGEYANILLDSKIEANTQLAEENSQSKHENAELSIDIYGYFC
mgnify:CR=1 FL=1